MIDTGRYLDSIQCNSLEDATCEPVPVSEPDPWAVQKLAYIYFNQYWMLIFAYSAASKTEG